MKHFPVQLYSGLLPDKALSLRVTEENTFKETEYLDIIGDYVDT